METQEGQDRLYKLWLYKSHAREVLQARWSDEQVEWQGHQEWQKKKGELEKANAAKDSSSSDSESPSAEESMHVFINNSAPHTESTSDSDYSMLAHTDLWKCQKKNTQLP